MHTAVLPSSLESKQLTRSSLRKTHPKLFLTGQTPEEDWQERRGCHLEPLGHLWRPHIESPGVCKCHAVGPKSGVSDTWQHRVNREHVTFPNSSVHLLGQRHPVFLVPSPGPRRRGWAETNQTSACQGQHLERPHSSAWLLLSTLGRRSESAQQQPWQLTDFPI